MKLNRKAITCSVLAVAFAVTATQAWCATGSSAVVRHASAVSETPGKAGILAAMTLDNEDIEESATIEDTELDMVTSSGRIYVVGQNLVQERELAGKEETTTTTTQTTQSEWSSKLMVDVKDSLNIRKGKSTTSKIVGVLLKGSGAKILEHDGAWVKIQSGDVTGYVKAEYCVFNQEAEELADKLGTTYAIAQTDGLRVRKSASSDAEVITILDSGSKLKVRTSAKEKKNWIAVTCDGESAYVSKQYVKVKLVVGKAISIKEYLAQTAEASSHSAANATADEVTLLGAIIQCEAGGESYQGQIAVGAVVMNRVRSSIFPDSIAGVIYQQGQFCPVASGVLAQRLSSGVSSSCLAAAREAIAGADNVNGALYFQVSSSGRSGLVIGHHVFY